MRLLAELAGHSHISTTQRYIDVNSEQLSEAVELLQTIGPVRTFEQGAANGGSEPKLPDAAQVVDDRFGYMVA